MRQLVDRDCPSCRETRTFEAPVCEDGHGDDCPELACTDCGYAILVGLAPEVRIERAAA